MILFMNTTATAAEKLARAEQMHGADRKVWTVANLKAAAKLGDAAASSVLARRAAKAAR
jgi:hypothetical protein